MRIHRVLTVVVALLALIAPTASPNARAADLPPGGSFTDDNGNLHEGNIEAIYAAGITAGCATGRYCPGEGVTRGQMAAFIDRAIGLASSSIDAFTDDEASPFEAAINRLAAAGITRGCADGLYCPNGTVTRGEMAAFLVRSLELPPSSFDAFSDDDASSFESDINALANAGVTTGCALGRYCPHGAVTRAEMASFLARGLGLQPIVPPPVAFAGDVIYVSVGHPAASDANPGTAAAPLRTIQAAIERASDRRDAGTPGKVLVAAGVYREHLHVGHSASVAPPLVIEAEQPGSVRVTGTDAWSGWQEGPTGIYSHEWSYDWTPASGVAEIVGRRELAFHAGTRLQQVLSIGALSPGSFFIDQPNNRVYVALAGGLQPTVEIAIRPQVLKVDGGKNVTIRGIEFSGAASPFGTSAVQITNVANVQFVDNVVRDNSWVGMSFTTSSDVTVQSSRIISNGGGGINAFKVSRLRLDASETSSNNWRGVRGDYTGWTIAGAKIVGSQDVTISGHTAIGNHTRGLWLDYDISGLLVRDSNLCGNLTDGLFIEAAQGPSNVINTVMCNNGRYGLLITNGRAVTVTESTLCGNAKSALRLETDGASGRTVNTASGSILLQGAENLTLTGNVFGGSPRLFDSNLPSGQWPGFTATVDSDRNTFSSAGGAIPFFYQGSAHTLAAWQTLTGEDGASTVTSASC